MIEVTIHHLAKHKSMHRVLKTYDGPRVHIVNSWEEARQLKWNLMPDWTHADMGFRAL